MWPKCPDLTYCAMLLALLRRAYTEQLSGNFVEVNLSCLKVATCMPVATFGSNFWEQLEL